MRLRRYVSEFSAVSEESESNLLREDTNNVNARAKKSVIKEVSALQQENILRKPRS